MLKLLKLKWSNQQKADSSRKGKYSARHFSWPVIYKNEPTGLKTNDIYMKIHMFIALVLSSNPVSFQVPLWTPEHTSGQFA